MRAAGLREAGGARCPPRPSRGTSPVGGPHLRRRDGGAAAGLTCAPAARRSFGAGGPGPYVTPPQQHPGLRSALVAGKVKRRARPVPGSCLAASVARFLRSFGRRRFEAVPGFWLEPPRSLTLRLT